jgi:preprotein translocase subunit SecY
MSRLGENFRNIFKIQELRTRILFTIGLLVVVRLGAHVPMPGVDATILTSVLKQEGSSSTLFELYDLFVGGAFSNAAVFALGIMPYISSSIILQLLGAVVPYFQKLQKEGEEGRKKITQYTRYGTVLIAALQAWGVSVKILNTAPNGMPLVAPEIAGWFTMSAIFVLTAGTIFMMWLGEQITERGIGNGISLIIFIGIIARFPNSVLDEYQLVSSGARGLIVEIVIWALMFFIVAGVVLVTQGTRRIPVQYAKRVVGRKVYGGVTQYIPMRVNTAGVMPIIFAQSIMFVPNTILTFFPESDFMVTLSRWFSYDHWFYALVYGAMIVFFTYFYTAIAFNPKDVADTMKKQGGFIPGIRPGQHTSDFIDNILTKITLPGSIFLAIVAILPTFISKMGVSSSFASFFGGTSLLIIVGVALDTLQQIESHLLMRHYDGFMKSGKIRGRIGR